MAVDVVGYRSRRRRETERAAKAKREKIVLAAGLLVLVVVLAFEAPKTLKVLHGGKAVKASAASTPPAGGADSTGVRSRSLDLSALKGLAVKDPFSPQLEEHSVTVAGPAAVTPPAVRMSHFVPKNPFVQQLTAVADAAPPTPATPPPAPTTDGSSGRTLAAGDYIVVLASVPVGDGRDLATRVAARARARGVDDVGVVDSSNYSTLRTGFYAVYSGPYPTLDRLLSTLEQVRGKGYPSAYSRRLAH
jgi:SPOR domain